MKTLPAYKYLIEERKLSENIIRAFHLAYEDSKGMIYVDADIPEPLKAPITETKQLDFRFLNSSVFPVFDLYNKIVGVSARPLVAKPDLPKYINTSYEKSEHLYGLNVTYPFCIAERTVYVVEGNLDVLSMYQREIKNVVGLLGSNFSSTQLALLIGFVEKIVFVLDGDMAGINFMEKLKGILTNRYKDIPVQFSFKFLPFDGITKVDPDSYLQNHTKEEFLALPEIEVKK